MVTQAATARRTDIYNDPTFNYAHFWVGREYEHRAEIIALRRLLGHRRFRHAVDIGGGYGRLSVFLTGYAELVTLVDPSSQQLELSAQIYPDTPALDRRLADAADLQFADGTADLVTLIRVLHHLPDPEPEFAELARILCPGGYAVVEIANSAHFVRRIRNLMRGTRTSFAPVDIRPESSRLRGTAPYFNHHPRMIARQLAAAGLEVRDVLSVSNMRHPVAKTLLPDSAMLAVERAVQKPLGRFYFGPSTFLLLQKADLAGANR